MITREEDVDAHALHRQGWTISAIARHLGRDRKTIRAYLHGDREAGVRAPAAADPFGPFAAYCTARLAEDPHLWATTLFDEVAGLGYDRSYPTFTRALRARGLRPQCEPCHPAKGRAVAVIEHPPGEETQWDWVELPDPPADWGWGGRAYLLVGALAHSGRWRGWLSASMDQPHLIEGLDQVTRALGGVTAAWRFDRMATVVHPDPGGSPRRSPRWPSTTACPCGLPAAARQPQGRGGEGQPRRGAAVLAHPGRRRHRRAGPAAAGHLVRPRGDVRLRAAADGKATVATLAAREPLRPAPPVPFPATVSVPRTVSAQALVSFRGNLYSVAPELARAAVIVAPRLGAGHLDIATAAGTVIARHALAPAGAGVMVRDHGHVLALEQAAMTASSPAAPHRRKQRIPPGPAALAAAGALRARRPDRPQQPAAGDAVIDLARYAAAAHGRNTLTT